MGPPDVSGGTTQFKLLYFAVYNAQFFSQIIEGKNKDVYYTWVVLIPYLYKCF